MAEDKPSIATQLVAASMVNKVLFDLVVRLAKDQAFASADGAAGVRILLNDLSDSELVNMTDLVPGKDFDLDRAMETALESLSEDSLNLYRSVFE